VIGAIRLARRSRDVRRRRAAESSWTVKGGRGASPCSSASAARKAISNSARQCLSTISARVDTTPPIVRSARPHGRATQDNARHRESTMAGGSDARAGKKKFRWFFARDASVQSPMPPGRLERLFQGPGVGFAVPETLLPDLLGIELDSEAEVTRISGDVLPAVWNF